MKITGIVRNEGTKELSFGVKFSDMPHLSDIAIPLYEESLLEFKKTIDALCKIVFSDKIEPNTIGKNVFQATIEGKQQLKHNVAYCHWFDMLKPKSVLSQDELDELIQTILIIDKKLEQITKADIGVNFVIGEGKVEMMDFRPSRKLEDVYLAVKKSIIEQIIGVK
jgi:hypothetical protein